MVYYVLIIPLMPQFSGISYDFEIHYYVLGCI